MKSSLITMLILQEQKIIFDGRCFESIRNLLPKRSKSLEDFSFDVGPKEVNDTKPQNKATKPSKNGWVKLRNSLKLQKYVEVLNNGKYLFLIIK